MNNYSNKEFKEYIKAINKRQYYDTGVDITNKDKLLTLQTCFEDSINKLIVVAKKTDTIQFDS